MRIALLEDNIPQAEIILHWLQEAGHAAQHYTLSLDLMNAVGRETFDVYILDWLLPDITGEEVLRWLRQSRRIDAPIIFLTSRDTEEDISSILNAGADDYIIKPARRQELLSRLDAVYRRAYMPRVGVSVIDAPPYRFETGGSRALYHYAPVEMTEKEFELALFFFSNLNRIISRAHLLEAVWGMNVDIPTRTIDTHISRIRNKLVLRPENGYQLKAVYNHGYRLEHVNSTEAS
ncbi:MAG: response regulator transcription factor [Sulfuriferula sp.]|nr:response regulator transcription factor [Sulfuriferula sp.]